MVDFRDEKWESNPSNFDKLFMQRLRQELVTTLWEE